MTEEEILKLIEEASGVSRSDMTVKTREGRQIKANALFEGSSSPASERVPVGVFFATKAPELAVQGAIRRMTLDVPYPEAIVAIFDATTTPHARVFGYGDSTIGSNLARALGTPLETVARPALAKEAKPASGVDSSALLRSLKSTPNVVLQGPPGTGKSSLAIELVRSLVANSGMTVNECRFGEILRQYGGDLGGAVADTAGAALTAPVIWEMVQLHPGYGYDDLVRRTRPTTREGDLQFVVQDRLLPQLCEVAENRGPDQPVVLILDEINRCDLSSVLGEFIFAIDPGHRSTPVRFQYQSPTLRASIAVPPNLWIVGTMNTADRSIALVDYAIRRRFRFVDVPADANAIAQWYLSQDSMRDAALELFELCNQGLPPAVMIGHSMFLVDPLPVETWGARFARQFAYHIAPLLTEYEREGLRHVGQLNWRGMALDTKSPASIAGALTAALSQLSTK